MVLEFEVLGFEFKHFRDDFLLAVPKVNIEKLDCRLTVIVCILLKQIISFILNSYGKITCIDIIFAL